MMCYMVFSVQDHIYKVNFTGSGVVVVRGRSCPPDGDMYQVIWGCHRGDTDYRCSAGLSEPCCAVVVMPDWAIRWLWAEVLGPSTVLYCGGSPRRVPILNLARNLPTGCYKKKSYVGR